MAPAVCSGNFHGTGDQLPFKPVFAHLLCLQKSIHFLQNTGHSSTKIRTYGFEIIRYTFTVVAEINFNTASDVCIADAALKYMAERQKT